MPMPNDDTPAVARALQDFGWIARAHMVDFVAPSDGRPIAADAALCARRVHALPEAEHLAGPQKS